MMNSIDVNFDPVNVFTTATLDLSFAFILCRPKIISKKFVELHFFFLLLQYSDENHFLHGNIMFRMHAILLYIFHK